MSSSRGGGAAAVLAGVAVMAAGVARGETLAEAISLAYQSNPTLQGQRATQRALDETYAQAQAGYRPTAQVQATASVDNNRAT